MRKASNTKIENIKNEVTFIFDNYICYIANVKFKSLSVVDTVGSIKSDDVFTYMDNKYVIKVETNNLNKTTRSLIKDILSQMSVITKIILANDFTIDDRYKYRDALYKSALMRGIIQWLSAGQANNLVYNLVDKLSEWSIRTYEHGHVKFGVIVQSNFTNTDFTQLDVLGFLTNASSATLSDGEKTFYVVDNKGKIQCLDGVKNVNEYLKKFSKHKEEYSITPFAPLQYNDICDMSKDANLGITLSENGEICCFKNQQLTLARLNSKWVAFDYYDIFLRAFEETFEDINKMDSLLKQVYLSCLDVAFAGTGGCIGIVKEKEREAISKILPSEEEYKDKIKVSPYYSGKFDKISREIRKELLAIDGACVVGEQGDVYSIGAIVKKVKPQKFGGARAASACVISKFGIAIKISADGYLQVFRDGDLYS